MNFCKISFDFKVGSGRFRFCSFLNNRLKWSVRTVSAMLKVGASLYICLYSEGYLSISGILCLSHFHFAEAYCGLTGIFFPKYICAAIKKARVLQSISLNLLHFNSKINASSY